CVSENADYENSYPEQKSTSYILVKIVPRCYGVFVFHNRDAITAIATVVIAFFTIVLALVTDRQARLTERSAETAEPYGNVVGIGDDFETEFLWRYNPETGKLSPFDGAGPERNRCT